MMIQEDKKDLRKTKLEKIKLLEELGVNTSPPYVEEDFQKVSDVKLMMGKDVAVVGRLGSFREHGNIVFADIVDESGQIQLFFQKKELGEKFKIVKLFDTGDFIFASGEIITTQAGEITLNVKGFQFLSKSLSQIPSQWYGLTDKEERFRKRYLDLLLNPEVKEVLDKRWAIERSIREFLWGEGYKEVETPILQNLYGGTNARPFTTHLNALDIDMYLRVAPELYLKRLIVGGYEKIFEIARNFRNEGMDQTHQPEFTMMEFYEAYADYQRIMDLAEGLTKYVAKAVNGSHKLKVGEFDVDLSGKWRRITVDQAVKEHLGIDWDSVDDEEIKKLLSQHKFKVPGVYSRDKALFTLYDHLVTSKLIEPTWVTDYPREVSPLSKSHRSKVDRVERFEGYIGGKEIFDGWSEIVSPVEQRERFENEQKNMKAGDDEAQPLDEEFLDALSYGCPPLGGIGIGIDRFTMFLTNTWSIKEVIPFPLMRPEK